MSNPTHARLDLDQLVQDYLENLQVNLRGFKAAESCSFLEAWVLHDDPTENVIELVDLARDAGLSRLTILVSAATLARLDRSHLAEIAGTPIRRDTPGGSELEFDLAQAGTTAPRRKIAEPASSSRGTVTSDSAATVSAEESAKRSTEQRGAIHQSYSDGIAAVLADVQHEMSPQPAPGQLEITARSGHLGLRAVVDPKTTIVRQAGFQGAEESVERGLLEMLCRVMEGRPIQECADHATIAVEQALRDKSLPLPVAGVVTPDNADPAFQLPQTLVRLLLADYRAQTGYSATQNFFDLPASAAWSKLSEQERFDKITAALAEDTEGSAIELVKMDGLKRVVVRFLSAMPSHRMQQLLVRLEHHLHRTVEPTLQLTAQVRMDANILRMPEQKK